MDGLIKATDIQGLKADLELQKKDAVDKESRINLELERLGKMIGELNKQFKNQSLRPDQKQQSELPSLNCTDAKSNGIYEISLSNFDSKPFNVACDAESYGGGWTIILRRRDGSEDFYRNWTEYQNGFGDLSVEFFLGLNKIHALTAERRQELLVVLGDFDGNEAFEKYEEFAIGSEDEQYVLHTLGDAFGTAGDSLRSHLTMKFSTYDRDNDNIDHQNCAETYTGAWWYEQCHDR